MLILKEIVDSKRDTVKKFVFVNQDNFIVEFSYINKNDGKDIICVPCQTMCIMGCKFCHCTDYINKIKTVNLSSEEIIEGIMYVINYLKLYQYKRTLLISFMGCGEPLSNIYNILDTMKFFSSRFRSNIPFIRYAIATSIPRKYSLQFFELTHDIEQNRLPVKIHFSLHYTKDSLRKEWMPSALDIAPSIAAIDYYNKLTGNKVEIHYCLIEGINDTEEDAIILVNLFKNVKVNVKFLFYNKKENMEYKASDKSTLNLFEGFLDEYNIPHEYYIPPGLDVGASCGQFLMDTYINNGVEIG